MFFEGRNVPLFDFLDTLSLSFIYKNERRQRCHDQKNNSKREFSNRTYLYEVEDGIDFFDAVRKASAEFVNTPDGRKIYYKKGSFSWLDFSLLFVAAGAGDQFGGLQLAMILSRETTLGLIVWMHGQKMKQRKS